MLPSGSAPALAACGEAVPAPAPGAAEPFTLPSLLLLLLPLLLHACLSSAPARGLFWRAAAPLPLPPPPPPPSSAASQLELYALGSACHRQYLELLTPMPRSARWGCRAPSSSVLAALAAGSRAAWDAPFDLGSGCALQWYAPAEACALVARLGTLVVVGDSLQRHLLQALFAVLRGDYALGATLAQRTTGSACLAACACDGQYSDLSGIELACSQAVCPREASAAFMGSEPDTPQAALACPLWARSHVSFTFAVFAPSDASNAGSPWRFDAGALEAQMEGWLAAAAEERENDGGGGGGVTFLLSPPSSHLGYHEAARRVIAREFVAPVRAMLARAGRGNASLEAVPRRLLCIGMSARQDNKPEYLEAQGNQHVRPYNAWLRRVCSSSGGSGEEGWEERLFQEDGEGAPPPPGESSSDGIYAGFLDTYPFTLNKTSIDGAHYNSEVNVPLAQALLNALAQGLGE
jgi:hypothetical protein